MIPLGCAMALGAAAAAAALYGRYRALPGWLTGPDICRLEDGGCRALFRTRHAALLGIPNSALGLAFYFGLFLGLLRHWPDGLLLAAASAALAMSGWLAWILVKQRLECRICWAGHGCNALIWVILLDRLI